MTVEVATNPTGWEHVPTVLRFMMDAKQEMVRNGKNYGSAVCPICHGFVGYEMAPNGHTRGQCETSGCVVKWIE